MGVFLDTCKKMGTSKKIKIKEEDAEDARATKEDTEVDQQEVTLTTIYLMFMGILA